MILWKYSVCNGKKLKFIKQQETSGLSSLGIRTTLSPLLGPLFLEIKMNKIIKKELLAGDKFIPEMHLRQPGFTYSACVTFTKYRQNKKNLKKQDIQDIFTKTN